MVNLGKTGKGADKPVKPKGAFTSKGSKAGKGGKDGKSGGKKEGS
jgi:hypothetical protein